MEKLRITWFGHSTFLILTPGGTRVLFDPWLIDNPACPPSMKKVPQADLILVSHGHSDHMGDVIPVARESGAAVVAVFELCEWLRRKGLSNLQPMNKGGSLQIAGLRVTMTDARHSSGYVDNGQMTYMGEPAGYVIRLEDGVTLYFAGDTALFGDMRLIGEMYRPDIAFSSDWRPIHDGSRRRGEGVRAARRPAGRPDALGHVPDADGNAGRTAAPRRTEGRSGD